MELNVRTVEEVLAMSPADLQFLAQVRLVRHRQDEAETALLVRLVDDSGAYLTDGHTNVVAWGLATHHWSSAEARRYVKLGRAMKWLPQFAASALAGELGVAQMHAIAATASNPRVREHLAGSDELFRDAARDLEFPDLITLLRHWEELADTDGARQRHDRAVHDRRAGVNFAGERAFLDACGPSYDGVVFDEVLAHYTNLEWQTEWDVLAAVHGTDMHPGLMERTPGQRRFDALQRIFLIAAGGTNHGTGPAITVELTIDQTTFEHELERLAGGHPEPITPTHVTERRCQDRNGNALDPRAVVAAALVGQVRRRVLTSDGVTLDLGRRQRLFNGPLREAVVSSSPRCTHIGCRVPGHHCEADHLIPYARGGLTNARNGGPACRHHNPLKNNGTRTLRDAQGRWHTYRPDGTEIGWPVLRVHLDHIQATIHALELALGLSP